MELSTIIYLLLAVFAWGVGAFLDKACLKHLDSSSAFYLRSLFMIVVFTPIVLWKFSQAKSALVSSDKWGPIFVLGSVVITMGGVFFYLKALSGGEATKIVPLSSAYPFVTFALAALFLGESVTLNRLFGTLLLTGGIYFISK